MVEFVAPQEYMVRPPQPLVYLFLFDVSYAAVSTGLLATSARTILDSLNRIPNADHVVVSLLIEPLQSRECTRNLPLCGLINPHPFPHRESGRQRR